jgi:hypothetical protein
MYGLYRELTWVGDSVVNSVLKCCWAGGVGALDCLNDFKWG